MSQTFSPHEPARPRRRPTPNRIPLSPAQLRSRVIARFLNDFADLIEEYDWTHAMAYGQAATGDAVGKGDIAYSDPASAIALRGANSTVREFGGAPTEAERDMPSLSSLRAALLEVERKIDALDSQCLGTLKTLRKRNGSKDGPAKQPTNPNKGIGEMALKATLEAQQRRRERGEGRGEG